MAFAKWYALVRGIKLTNPKLNTSDCGLNSFIAITSIAIPHMQANAPAATVIIFASNLENIDGEFVSLDLNFLPSSFNHFTLLGKMEGICKGPFVLSYIFTGKVCSSLFKSGFFCLANCG